MTTSSSKKLVHVVRQMEQQIAEHHKHEKAKKQHKKYFENVKLYTRGDHDKGKSIVGLKNDQMLYKVLSADGRKYEWKSMTGKDFWKTYLKDYVASMRNHLKEQGVEWKIKWGGTAANESIAPLDEPATPAEPVKAEAEAAEPEAGKGQQAAEPEATKPEAPEPEATEPEAAEPVAPEPEAAKAKAEAEKQAETEPAAAEAAKAEAEKQAETQAETEPAAAETETQAETEPAAAEAAKAKAEAEKQAETEPAAAEAAKAESEKQAETQAETEPAAAEAEKQAETEPAAAEAAKAEAEKQAETQTEAEAAAKADTAAEKAPNGEDVNGAAEGQQATELEDSFSQFESLETLLSSADYVKREEFERLLTLLPKDVRDAMTNCTIQNIDEIREKIITEGWQNRKIGNLLTLAQPEAECVGNDVLSVKVSYRGIISTVCVTLV
jgi:hypothetical protein